MDIEALATARLLYTIAEQLREVRLKTWEPRQRDAIAYAINLVELAAINTAAGRMDLEEADAWADSAQITLRQFRSNVIPIRDHRHA